MVPDQAVLVGRPPHVIRTATERDRDRVAALREYQTERTEHPGVVLTGPAQNGGGMGTLYAYGDNRPVIDPTAFLFDSAEITGDVTVGAKTVIGAGVKIIGDSHGPVRVGARVQILENTVLHLLPDNELIIEDDVVIGPGAMIHGCRVEAGSVIEPGAIVCDDSVIGAGSIVRAGACVKQRAVFGAGSVIDGFPAVLVGVLDAPPAPPGWTLPLDAATRISRIHR